MILFYYLLEHNKTSNSYVKNIVFMILFKQTWIKIILYS